MAVLKILADASFNIEISQGLDGFGLSDNREHHTLMLWLHGFLAEPPFLLAKHKNVWLYKDSSTPGRRAAPSAELASAHRPVTYSLKR